MQSKFYKRNPGIFAYFKLEEDQFILDFDETQVDIQRMMVLFSDIVNNYLKLSALQDDETNTTQNKEISNGKTKKGSNRGNKRNKGK